MAVAITRTELPAADLRRKAARTRDAKAARRMLAIALVLEGRPRGEAAAQCGMDRQALRDWVHRYNAEGIAGLSDRPGRPGPKPCLSPAQEAEVGRWVEAGPDPAEHGGLARWRRTDLRDRIERRFGPRLHERTVGKLLRRLRFRRLSVRPRHPESDPAAQEAFKKTSPLWRRRPCRPRRRASRSRSGSRVERAAINARVGQQGTITRVWARRGPRPRAPRDRRHTWAWLFGAACPARGVGAALVLPEVNAEATGLHLAEIGRRVASGAHAIVLCDGAGWHQQGGRLVVPDNLTLLPLPPYAPELNAMENVWEYLRGNRLSHKVWDAYDAILDACCDAWNSLAEEPQRLTSITNRSWAKAVIE